MVFLDSLPRRIHEHHTRISTDIDTLVHACTYTHPCEHKYIFYFYEYLQKTKLTYFEFDKVTICALLSTNMPPTIEKTTPLNLVLNPQKPNQLRYSHLVAHLINYTLNLTYMMYFCIHQANCCSFTIFLLYFKRFIFWSKLKIFKWSHV